MAGAILILLWIQHEVSYDRFHEKGDQLYEAYHQRENGGKIGSWNSTSVPMGPALKAEYPEVEATSRYANGGKLLFNTGGASIDQQVVFVDREFFDLFSFPFIAGNPQSAFAQPNSIVLTESTAKKLFGDKEAMGQTIQLENEERYSVIVTGILKDLPANTRFRLDATINWHMYETLGYADTSPHAWTNSYLNTFVLLKPDTDVEAFNAKIRDISRRKDDLSQLDVFVYPSAKWHLYERVENGQPVGGRIDRVYLFGAIAVFVLLIACINFMNLSTARSERRAKEVGVRKVAGARRGMLIGQFISESILLAVLAGIIALLLVALTLPLYETLIAEQLYIPYDKPVIWLAATGFILATGLLAGSYPAFFLSAFQPAKVLKGTHVRVRSAFNLRKMLVVLQFTFAIALIICTLIVRQQIQHAENRDTGYSRDQLMTVYLNDISRPKSDLIRQEIIDAGAATSITKTGAPMTRTWSNSGSISWEGKAPGDQSPIHRFAADKDWTKTSGVQLVAGRDIDVGKYPTDSTAMLLNEAAVKTMGFDDPIGKIVEDNYIQYTVVGVVKNFLINSPYKAVEPMIIAGPKAYTGVMTIKLNGERKTSENLTTIGSIFHKYNPEHPLDYEFADEQYAAKFRSEQRTAALTGLFSGLAIFISCLGLFGLAAHTAEQRSKEIGVRKVLGASVGSIVRLLSKDFVRLVAISFVIASPIAYYAMEHWLQDFAYRISVEWGVFAMTALLAVTIAVLTVSFQAIRAAMANPVDSLRDE